MNPKFFDVKKEKQDAIINAALMVFAENGYRKASTDVIVKEAGISKGLLFHYFISKSGVYEFIYDYSVKYMTLELTNAVNKKETDFFTIQSMIEACKTRVMKNYPYMQQFLTGAKYETHPDALKVINTSEKAVEDAYNTIYKKVDMSKFPDDVDLKKVIRMIGWMSDGYIKDKFMDGTPDLDEMNAEFAGYLAMLRAQFYGKSKAEPAPEVKEPLAEEVVRDDSVMDSMRETTVLKLMEEKNEELSFEEKLERGKRSAYDNASAEPATEDEVQDTEEVKADESGTDEEVKEEVAETKAAEIEEAETTEAETVTEEAGEAEEDRAEEEAGEDEAEETEESEEAEESEEVDEEVTDEEDEAEEVTDKGTRHDKEMREVTISIDDFSDAFKSVESYTYGDTKTLYAASGAVKTYIPDSAALRYYETSRLGDFTYGSDSRGGRGIPYDSSDNIQIFVAEDDGDIEEIETSDNDSDFDIADLSDKIMSNTEKESAEFDRARELREMGPAPVLPDFSPDKLRKINDNMNDEDDENNHIYRPVNF